MADTVVKIEEPKQPDKKPRRFFWSNLGVLISGFAVIVLILSLGFVYFGLLNTAQLIASSVDNLAQSVSQSESTMTTAQKSVNDMQDTIHQLKDALDNQNQTIAALQKSQSTRQENMLVQEAGYLIRLASDNLQFENNIPEAIKLLQTADQDIAKTSDPQIFPVREAISGDLATLRSAAVVDVAGLYLRLSALEEELDKLPANNHFVAAPKTENTNSENLPWWRRGLQSIAEGLQRVIIIQKNHANELPFVMPDQRMFLLQNLHAQVNQAKWGLLHQKADVYRQSLQTLADWIKKYIPADSPVTQDVIASLTKLQQSNIQPPSVNVENSLQAFQSYLKVRA